MIRSRLAFFLGMLLAVGGPSAAEDLDDLAVVDRCDAGLAKVMEFVRERPELFTKEQGRLLSLEEKREVWNCWKSFLEYQAALSVVAEKHKTYYRLAETERTTAFFTGHAAAVTQYRYALQFLYSTRGHKPLEKLLDEAAPEMDLGKGSFSKFRRRFLNEGRGLEFAAREVLYEVISRSGPLPRNEQVRAHADYIWSMGKGRGQAMTVENALKIVRKAGFNAWLPIQTGVSEWMGDTRVYRPKSSLITREQIAALKLQPGDIMLQRRDWYLSNLGLPGFWPHTAIYIGTKEERGQYFDDPETRAWVREQGEASGDLEKLLEARYPEVCGRLEEEAGNKAPVRVIEAVSEGVAFTTLEHSAAADSLAVLRPKLDKKAKAAAILRAFHYAGRPYDFNFDFDTDEALVCTELVCKAYEPNRASDGLRFPIETMLGRKVVPANAMARQFDVEFGTKDQQTELVVFLDANEKARRAEPASVKAFRESWKRPKWHVFVQN